MCFVQPTHHPTHAHHSRFHLFAFAFIPQQSEVGRLPVYGLGHSLGSVLHTLITARYSPQVGGW